MMPADACECVRNCLDTETFVARVSLSPCLPECPSAALPLPQSSLGLTFWELEGKHLAQQEVSKTLLHPYCPSASIPIGQGSYST